MKSGQIRYSLGIKLIIIGCSVPRGVRGTVFLILIGRPYNEQKHISSHGVSSNKQIEI